MSYTRGYASFDPYGGLTEDEELTVDGPYWLRHWRGQLALAQSYWVNGFAVNVAIVLGQAFILGLSESRQLVFVAWGFVIFVLAASVLRVWSFVGIWRSAGRHVDRGGSGFWAGAARAMVIFGVLSLAVTAPRLWSQVREMGLIAIGHDPIGKPASIAVSPDGRQITLDGYITSGVGKDLKSTLDAAPNARTLLLNSHGGRILEALGMADSIRARQLDTRVVENCESACTLLFLAGAQRSASPLAQIGFHQPNFPGLSSEQRQEIIRGNSDDYREAGIDEDFIQRIMATPPEKMWYPTNEEMVQANVLNAIQVSPTRSEREKRRLDEVLKQAVQNINARRGSMVDGITRLGGATLKDGVILIDYIVTKPIVASPAQVAADMTPIMRKQVCAGADQAMILAGGKYHIDYRYTDGRRVGTVVIDRC